MKREIFFLLVLLAFVGTVTARPAAEDKQDRKTAPAQAPDLTYHVVVTANRVETPAREVASSVLVLTRADLARTRKLFVLEALQELAGLTVQENGAPGAAATVMLRGANSEHTLVLMDGVELNDPISPSRSFDFGHLLLEDIERIEVILGPQSPLYGSDALGGVINIVTRRAQDRPGLSLFGFGGSYGTAAGRLACGLGRGPWDFSLDASGLGSAGYSSAGSGYQGNSERDGYSNLSLSGRLGYAPRDNLSLDLVVRDTSARTDLDNFGGDYGDDPNNRQDYSLFYVRAQVRSLLFNNRWEQRLALSYVAHHRSYDNPVDPRHPLDSERGTYDSRQATLDWQNTIYAHESNAVTFGLEAHGEDGRSDYVSDGAWGPSESLFPRKSARTIGVYIQDQVRLGGRFFAALGGRLDSHDRFGRAVTWRLAPAYIVPGTETKLRMAVGTGFKSPSLYQLYAPGTFWGPIGNAGLEPETSAGWDAGLEQPVWSGRILLGFTYFHNDFRNLIQFDFIRGYTNTGRAESKGVEVFASAFPGAGMSLRAGFTRTEARDLSTGLALLRRPRDKFTLRWASPFPAGIQLALSLVAVGSSSDMAYIGSASSRVELKGYTLVNAVLSRDISSWGQVFLRLDNILDQRYETVYGYGMPRLAIYAGLSLALHR
jgi:vitamin B12 transporter